MPAPQPLIIGIGEVLWDMLPSGKQLGGAPANFVYHAHALRARALLISAVGKDELGNEIKQRLDSLKLDTSLLQTHPTLPTGTVTVKLDSKKQPHYTIHENVAWDSICWNEDFTQLALEANAICFGSLAQRSFISRSTIQSFLQHAHPQCLRVFDLNLRQHYFTPEIVTRSLALSNILKLNDEEWPQLAEMLKLPAKAPAGVQQLADRYNLRLVALTRGAAGSMLVTRDTVHEQRAAEVSVVDPVGAGDAFTAALVVGLLRNASLPVAHVRAAALAAHVCTQKGATPRIPLAFAKGW